MATHHRKKGVSSTPIETDHRRAPSALGGTAAGAQLRSIHSKKKPAPAGRLDQYKHVTDRDKTRNYRGGKT